MKKDIKFKKGSKVTFPFTPGEEFIFIGVVGETLYLDCKQEHQYGIDDNGYIPFSAFRKNQLIKI